MNVADLRPFAKRIDLVVKALDMGEVREVTAKATGEQHRVTEALVGDGSGTVRLTLWDDMIEKVEAGRVYKVTNGYVTTFRDAIRVNIGRYGTLEESEEEVKEVNEENNMSERNFGRGAGP